MARSATRPSAARRQRLPRLRCAVWLAVLTIAICRVPAMAVSFTWATDGDVGAMDPDTRNETVQLSFLANIYEPLVRRNRTLGLEPALAENWKQISQTQWRFHLRHGVTWQDGLPLTADDVVFSWHRSIANSSGMRSALPGIRNVTAVDADTVDIVTKRPMPLLLQELTTFLIMSKAWCQKHDAAVPVLIDDNQHNYATDHAMGTGPFELVLRQPGRRIVLRQNRKWWDTPPQIDRAELDVIGDPVRRVAALLAGKVDMLYAVPPASVDQLAHAAGIRLMESPDLRTIFLGMQEARAELDERDPQERNPFKQRLVREAVLLSIDEPAIVRHVMHGLAHPTALMWGPGVFGYDPALDKRPAVDLAKARADLQQAGYPHGFTVRFDCSDDRYVNDAAICQRVTGMLARVGIDARLHLEDKTALFRRIGMPAYRAGLFLLGWTPSTYDAFDTLYSLAATRKLPRGMWNCGGFSDPALDQLIDRIGGEFNPALRGQEIDDAARIIQQDVAFIPLHQQMIVWAVRQRFGLVQPADDYLPLRYVTVASPEK